MHKALLWGKLWPQPLVGSQQSSEAYLFKEACLPLYRERGYEAEV